MKKLVLVSAVAGALSMPLASMAAETSPYSGNVGLFSNYIFRGVTQTSEKAALQGGFDAAYSNGLYVGTWGSNISWISDLGGYTGSSLELDVYGGYKNTIGSTGIGYDVGLIYYYYPGEKLSGTISADTAEVYGALSWKWLSLKLSYAATDYFGVDNGKGTTYVDLGFAYPIGDLTLMAHYGNLHVAGDTAGASNDKAFGYGDWKVGATYALPQGFTVGAVYTDTNAEAASYTVNGKNWADGQWAVYLTKAL